MLPAEYGNWFLRTTNTKQGYQLATIGIKIVSLVSTIGWSVFMMAKPLVFRAHQIIAIHKWISGRTWRYQQRWIWLAHGNTPPNLGMDQNVVLSKEQDGLGRRSEDGGQQPQQISAIGYDYVSAMGFSTFLKPPTVDHQFYPLVICYIAIEHITFIVDLPIQMVIFYSYVNVYPRVAIYGHILGSHGALGPIPPRFAHSTADDDMSIPTQTDVRHPTGAPNLLPGSTDEPWTK